VQFHAVDDGQGKENRGGKKSVDHDAGQKQRVVQQEPPRSPGHDKHQKNGGQRAAKSKKRHTQAKGARAQHNPDNRPQRRSAGNAQHIGIGQRIAQERLKNHAA